MEKHLLTYAKYGRVGSCVHFSSVPFLCPIARSVRPSSLHAVWRSATCRSYVVVVTASSFNLIAMICSESYDYNRSMRHLLASLNDHPPPPPAAAAANLPVQSSSAAGSRRAPGCTLFGVLMVDASSLLVHLGPTIIGGGDFYHRATASTGPCLPVHAAAKVRTSTKCCLAVLSYRTCNLSLRLQIRLHDFWHYIICMHCPRNQPLRLQWLWFEMV